MPLHGLAHARIGRRLAMGRERTKENIMGPAVIFAAKLWVGGVLRTEKSITMNMIERVLNSRQRSSQQLLVTENNPTAQCAVDPISPLLPQPFAGSAPPSSPSQYLPVNGGEIWGKCPPSCSACFCKYRRSQPAARPRLGPAEAELRIGPNQNC